MNRGLQPLIGFDNKLVSLIHGVDLVKGFILAGEADISASAIYFISSEKFYNWRDVGEMTQKLLGRKTIRVVIVCVQTDDDDLLIPMKVYEVTVSESGYFGVTDEAGERAVYPAEFFLLLDIPAQNINVLKNARQIYR
jgi:nucleoside-diphosphate-sugar epimerase